MRYVWLLMINVVMSTGVFAQPKFEISKDPENGSVVFKGPISFSDLEKEASFTWFLQYKEYKPDINSIDVLKMDLPAYDLVVVMGTWCEDSQNLVPKLRSVLELAGAQSRAAMFGVDRTKDALNGEKARYGVEKVPTIIVYKDGKEVGRIVEVVAKSVEEDLVQIINRKR